MIPDLQAVMAETKAEFPSFKVVSKADSWLMRAISGSTSAFTMHFATTVGTTTYLPTQWPLFDAATRCEMIRHERVHMRQAKRFSLPLYVFLYAFCFFPVILSYFRMRCEAEAYEESLQARADYGLDFTSPAYKEHTVGYFTTSTYGWMWPFGGWVGKWFDAAVTKVKQ